MAQQPAASPRAFFSFMKYSRQTCHAAKRSSAAQLVRFSRAFSDQTLICSDKNDCLRLGNRINA